LRCSIATTFSNPASIGDEGARFRVERIGPRQIQRLQLPRLFVVVGARPDRQHQRLVAGFELGDGGSQGFAGGRVAQAILRRQPGDPLRKHPLPAGLVDDRRAAAIVFEAAVEDDMRADRQTGDDEQRERVTGGHRARGNGSGIHRGSREARRDGPPVSRRLAAHDRGNGSEGAHRVLDACRSERG
jgi:hypothetical protein